MYTESEKHRSLFSKYKRLSSREEKIFNKEIANISLEIYAELSKKQYSNVSQGLSEIIIPRGVTMSSVKRSLHFKCENEELAIVMKEALDNSGINWQ